MMRPCPNIFGAYSRDEASPFSSFITLLSSSSHAIRTTIRPRTIDEISRSLKCQEDIKVFIRRTPHLVADVVRFSCDQKNFPLVYDVLVTLTSFTKSDPTNKYLWVAFKKTNLACTVLDAAFQDEWAVGSEAPQKKILYQVCIDVHHSLKIRCLYI